MIVVTGAAGFVGSVMIAHLLKNGHDKIVAIDDFSRVDKNRNLENKNVRHLIHRDQGINWMKNNSKLIKGIFHLGARTDTTEFDKKIFNDLNIQYSISIWKICTEYNIPFIYASSAATYGSGSLGYDDDHGNIINLQPLNPYGESKQVVDEYIIRQVNTPSKWYGFKFFNVYGPNEYHKGRMASVVFHAFNQIKSTGGMKLFRSHRDDIKDGYQSRDFIYIQDVVEVLYWFYRQKPENGIYNLGTGQARPFLHLTQAVFKAMNISEKISFIDTPEDIRETYQYFTEAKMSKLKEVGCPVKFKSLEDGVTEYVQSYLKDRSYC